jgi:hypothetical protein
LRTGSWHRVRPADDRRRRGFGQMTPAAGGGGDGEFAVAGDRHTNPLAFRPAETLAANLAYNLFYALPVKGTQ